MELQVSCRGVDGDRGGDYLHPNIFIEMRQVFSGLMEAWSETFITSFSLHCAPLVLDGAAVFICPAVLLTDPQDGGFTSGLCELQPLFLSMLQLLQTTILLSSFQGEADQKRKHV